MHLKLSLVLLWVVGILVVMCTSDAKAFLYDQDLHYELTLQPDFYELLKISDIGLTDEFYLIQKAGHILSFGILYMLVLNWLRSHYKALLLCTLFAFSSEIIQLFFQRNGRLFDVGVDLVGIFLAYKISSSLKKVPLDNVF